VEEILDDMHEALKPHLGENVPRPTMWIGAIKWSQWKIGRSTLLKTFAINWRFHVLEVSNFESAGKMN